MAQLDDMSTGEMLALLEWYRDAGVDIAVGETPIDRLSRQPAPMPVPRPATSVATLPESAARLGGDPAEAHALAATATSLDELQAMLAAYDGCPLKFRATQLVFADGNPNASIMLIGEAPGAEEDRIGKPFVGRSGQLLDRMLGAIGLDRTAVYIANTVPWRPPGNREPTPEEIAQCLPFMVRQVELVAPKLIVTIGGLATRQVFDTKQGILKMRGKVGEVSVGAHTAPAIAMLHPAYLLRNPAAKALAWRDMLEFAALMDAHGVSPKKGSTGP
jgi:uracil-DNA glycosylase family 4